MTDRIVAVLVEYKHGKVLSRHEEALTFMYAVESATMGDDCILIIFDRDIRTDDFELFDDALDLFGFKIVERIINDGPLAMDRSVAILDARRNIINDYAAKKPTLVSNVPVDTRRFIVDMAGWSHQMKKILEMEK